MSLQDLQSRHQAERKTLEANNQKAIQAAEKKGKQQKVKAVTAAAVALAELDERHEREEAAVRSNTNTTTATTSTSTRSTTADAEEKPASIVSDADAHEDNDGPKVSKAQKKRLAKEQAEAERLARIEEALKDVKPQGEEENNRLRSQLQSLGLVVKPVAADGNCLYNSILDQLETRSVTTAAPLREQRALRALIADHMRAHRADYAAFVTDTDTDATSGGDKRDAFEAYCDAIVNTVSWGGQLEVRAAAAVLACVIRIHSADAQPVVMGDSTDASRVLDVSYHRQAFALGEHYNSLRRVPVVAPAAPSSQ